MNTVQAFPISEIPHAQDSSSYLTQLQEYILPECLSSSGEFNWGRLICTWHQKDEKGHIHTHTYAACIDGREGGIYTDCSPGKIFLKCVAHLFIRPLYTVVKTIYQLSLYPIFQEIANAYRSVQTKNETIKNICKSLADIILTPICGLILTVATVVVLIFGSFSVENLYEGRKFLGKIEQASNWGQSHTFLTLAKCFQPHPLESLEFHGKKHYRHDTVYQEEGTQDQVIIERQLANHARVRIRHKQRCFDIFSCSKLKLGTVYQSPFFLKQ